MDFSTARTPEQNTVPPEPNTYSQAPVAPRQESTVWRGAKLTIGAVIVLGALLFFGLAGCTALIVAGVAASSGSGGAAPAEVKSVEVRVSGDPGVRYSGNYGTTVNGGTSVDGEVGYSDGTYQVPVEGGAFDFDMVSAMFQKMSRDGTLGVEIVVNGEVVKAQETSAKFGVVDVSYSPQVD